jgi:channel protein (hemolysin III family)
LSGTHRRRDDRRDRRQHRRIEIAPILVYVIGLVTMLPLSAAYNMWPGLARQVVLRRLDHSAIYLLIAGTYTSVLAQMKNVLASAGLGSRALAYSQLVSRTYR